MNCYETTNCNDERRSACFVYNNFYNSPGGMDNISCWTLKRGNPGWTQEDQNRCEECPYYTAVNRHGVNVSYGRSNTVIIECSGTLNMLRTAALGEVADKLRSLKRNRVILDLSAVTNIYSCAMSMIVRFHLQCEELGGSFIMAGATGYVQVAIGTVSLDKLIKTADTTEEALGMLERSVEN